jgi:hemerythrin-like domain-containing protein
MGKGTRRTGEEPMAEQTGSVARADTRLLQAVHKAFRLATDRFVDATERLEPSALAPIIRDRWSFYATVLHHHHHNEDDIAFPALVAVRPEIKELLATLGSDHQRLNAHMDAVDAAVSSFEKQPDPESREAVHRALVVVRDEFFPHLDTEDELVIPAFAESIPPAQWDRMDNQALRTIPRTWLPTAVGALDEVIRRLPESERPLPPPVPVRAMLRLSWRKKYAAWIEPMVV